MIGHGSGSFGHPAAQKAKLVPGRVRRHRLAGVSTTQLEARQLHARVLEALDEAGLCPFSLPPSAFLITAAGRPVHSHSGADCTLPRTPVWCRLSTATSPWIANGAPVPRRPRRSFRIVISRLRRRKIGVRRVVWAGETDGVLDADGNRLRRISPRNGRGGAREPRRCGRRRRDRWSSSLRTVGCLARAQRRDFVDRQRSRWRDPLAGRWWNVPPGGREWLLTGSDVRLGFDEQQHIPGAGRTNGSPTTHREGVLGVGWWVDEHKSLPVWLREIVQSIGFTKHIGLAQDLVAA